MKTSDGSFHLHQCFNGQAVVDSHAQVIVAAALRPSPRHPSAGTPPSSSSKRTSRRSRSSWPQGAKLLGDAGYFSEENVTVTTAHRLDPHLATGRLKHSERIGPAPRGRIPKDATL